MSGLYLVADDLTGALDSAAPFCGRYGPIPVFLGLPHADGLPHAAVDAATRDGSPAAAAASSVRVLTGLARAELPFKKIDSRLRGHWAAELASLLRSGVFGGCVFAPAFPSQGRETEHGWQWVRGADGTRHACPDEPLQILHALGLRVGQVGAGEIRQIGAARMAESEVVVFDAITDADLQAVVDSVPRRLNDKPILWCGAGGLARALAGAFAGALGGALGGGAQAVPCAGAPARPTLAIIGTDHAVSRVQVAQAVRRLPLGCHVIASKARGDAVAAVSNAFDRQGACLLTFGFDDEVEPRVAAAEIAQTLQTLLPTLARPASLVVAGGETLLAVCRAVGALRLDVVGERSAGVPSSRLRDGLWDGVDVVSKSGGFGAEDWLAALLPRVR